jgi:uncharacterized protein (UPF0332 family)
MNEDLILYRRQKSRETLEDAHILFQKGRLFSALNRIYYALFYEVMALLLTKDLSSARHTGIRALFNEHFVKTGKVKVELGRFFSRMYDFRQKGDYADFVQFELKSGDYTNFSGTDFGIWKRSLSFRNIRQK